MSAVMAVVVVCTAHANEYTSLLYEMRDSTVHVTLPRVGSGPGEENVDFRVDLKSSSLQLQGEPLRYSATAFKVSDTLYGDTFYWPHAFSVQHFTHNAAATAENILGLATGSDIWQQFAWMEICPKHRRIFLHKKGAFDDVRLHECGKGELHVHTAQCVTPHECLLHDSTTQLEHFGMAQRGDRQVDMGTLVHGFTGTADVEEKLDGDGNPLPPRVYAHDLGVYSTVDPETGTVNNYREYESKHTHSTAGFLVIESLLLFFLHFVSDQAKDVDGCKWTRYPAYVGNTAAVVCMSLLYYHFDLAARIFQAASLFRRESADQIAADGLLLLVFFLSAIVHILLQVSHEQMPLRRMHLEVLYDLVLQFPITLALMGGGRYNLMNLLFLFVVSLVVMGSRVRDILSIGLSFYRRTAAHTWKDGLLYTIEALSVAVYFILVWNTVWVPSFQSLFVLPTAPYLASACGLVIFCVTVGRLVYDYDLYTVVSTNPRFKTY